MRDVREDIDDLDDFVVADMRGVGGLRPPTPSGSARDVREELGDAEEQAMVILGTLKAALSIGMVYVIGLGIAIAIMLWLWT